MCTRCKNGFILYQSVTLRCSCLGGGGGGGGGVFFLLFCFGVCVCVFLFCFFFLVCRVCVLFCFVSGICMFFLEAINVHECNLCGHSEDMCVVKGGGGGG